MPVNPPTGGWSVLDDKLGIEVKLPTTVEEHFWGKFGTRPYAPNEAQRGAGTSFPNGNYLGVSWWWREIDVPKFKAGQRVIVSLRGERLRAEVYCNGKLCRYTIMTELPFEANLTDAVKSGQKATLAVRITNPDGNLDWIDYFNSESARAVRIARRSPTLTATALAFSSIANSWQSETAPNQFRDGFSETSVFHPRPFSGVSRLLRPLGRPAPNGQKFFCSAEIVEFSSNQEWLDKATRTITRCWQEKNRRAYPKETIVA